VGDSLALTTVPIAADGVPTQLSESFRVLLEEGASGGAGTGEYLRRMTVFSDFVRHAREAGPSLFVEGAAKDGTPTLRATDGHTTVEIQARMDPALAHRDVNGVGVVGIATVTMTGPDPYAVTKLLNIGIQVGEIGPSIVVSQQLVDALIRPLLGKVCDMLSSAMDKWGDLAVDDPELLAAEVGEATAEAAEEASAEAVEIAADEVAIELSIELSAVAPPLAAMAVLLAIPLLITFLEKRMTHHLEIVNLTKADFAWSLGYQDDATVRVQPKDGTIPAMARVTDAFGDVTDDPVAYAAQFTLINSSGFSGLGYLIELSAAGSESVGLAVSIPFFADNGLWIGPMGATAEATYEQAGFEKALRVQHGDRHYMFTASIDALSGSDDDYHSVVRIEEI